MNQALKLLRPTEVEVEPLREVSIVPTLLRKNELTLKQEQELRRQQDMERAAKNRAAKPDRLYQYD